MRLLVFLLSICLYLQAAQKDILEFDSFEEAIANYEKLVEIEKSHVYFYKENNKYFVVFDPNSDLEATQSFLQIFSSKNFENVLAEYREIENKQDLYIKKFHQLYFLRLKNSDITYTQKMFLKLEKKFPHIYHSKPAKKTKIERSEEISKSKVVFLKNRYELEDTDTVNDIVMSTSKQERIRNLTNELKIGSKHIKRENNLQIISDLENAVSNFGIVRGDILGLKNIGAYNLSAYSNYGILCSPSQSVLHLVGNSEIKSIYDLRFKKVSIGNVSDIAQVYLKNVAEKSGMIKDIEYKSLSIDDSIVALRDGKIDAFFLFAPKEYIYKYLENNFYISSIPDDIRSGISLEEGLNNLRYKINERVLHTFKTPNYIISPIATLDINIANKIEVVAQRYGCFRAMKIPKPFYGQLHPELLAAFERIKAKLLADKLKKEEEDKAKLLAAQLKKDEQMKGELAKNALDDLRNAVNVTFVEKKEHEAYTEYMYKASNVSSKNADVSFEYIKTDFFDKASVKPHHVIQLSSTNPLITVEANSAKFVSFKYANPYAFRIDELTVELVFKDHRYTDRTLYVPLVIGETEQAANFDSVKKSVSKTQVNGPNVKVKVKTPKVNVPKVKSSQNIGNILTIGVAQ